MELKPLTTVLPRPDETTEEHHSRIEKLEYKKNLITSLTINNIRVSDVGLVLLALEELGLDVEINI